MQFLYPVCLDGGINAFFAFFRIKPVGRNAAFGFLVHKVGADLDFKNHVIFTKHRRVQTLVTIGFG
jgi:hypothetical protein